MTDFKVLSSNPEVDISTEAGGRSAELMAEAAAKVTTRSIIDWLCCAVLCCVCVCVCACVCACVSVCLCPCLCDEEVLASPHSSLGGFTQVLA